SIASADDRNKLKLKRRVKILHVCDLANDLSARLASIKYIMEGVMDTMLKDSTGNTFDAPAQPLVNFVVSEYVSIGNICGPSSPPTAPSSPAPTHPPATPPSMSSP
ncbi:hypothetical protein BKA60DRAFT_406245, partial [Fusarium oxysporum]